MSTISSHILDSIDGCSAIGIQVQLFKLISPTERELVFDTSSDEEGRIMQTVNVTEEQEFEMVFHCAAYFENTCNQIDETQYMPTVVVRFNMKDRAQRYHIPLVLSPHSYTLWWSK